MRSLKIAFVLVVACLGLARAEPSLTVQSRNYPAGSVVNEWAQYTIQTSGTVSVKNGANVSFSTSNLITLYPGFNVELGGVFSAKISASPSYNPGGYYNTITPTLVLVSGDQQYGQIGQFNLQPFDFAVWNAAGTAPLANAPVLLTVNIGGGWLSMTNDANAVLSKNLQLVTDNDGTVHAYYQQGSTAGVTSYIQVVAGTQIIQFTTYSTLDTTAPSIPVGLVASDLATTSFTLSWNASSDNIGVVGYEIFQNGSLIGTSASPSYAVANLAPLTAYSMTVKSKDAAGNLSAASATLSVTTTADTAAPTAPTGLSVADVSVTSFTLSWTASTDNVAVTGYDVYRDGVLIGSSSSLSYAVGSLAPATSYSMTVKAKDAAGNASVASTALSVTTTPDTAAPSVPTALVAGEITATGFTLNWTAASDNVGVAEYLVFRDGVQIGTPVAAVTIGVGGLTASTAYSMTVKARDAAGNVSAASQALTVTTQSAAPSTEAWEVAFFGATGVNFTDDPDDDGLTNLQEYQQGRHPLVSDGGAFLYVDAARGNDTTYNGRSVWPGQPTAAHGPKATLTAAINAATTGDTILILPNASAYPSVTLSPVGKDLVLRPVGNVRIQP